MSVPAPRRRRNQLVPLVASSHAQTVRPSVKIARPSSCALPEDPAASPHPANATSSGGFGNCATGKRRGQPNWPRRQSSTTVTALMFARRRLAVQAVDVPLDLLDQATRVPVLGISAGAANLQSLLKRARTEARYANFTVRVATTLPLTSMLKTTGPRPSWRKARLDR